MNTNRSKLVPLTTFSLALITGLIFCCRTSSARDPAQLQAIWRKEVKGSKQFFNWFKSHVTGSVFTSTTKLLMNGEQETIKSRQVMKRKDPFFILGSEALNASPMAGTFCYGINSKYAFKLKKAKNGKDWVVQNIVEVIPEFEEKNLGVNMSGSDPATGERIEGFRGTVNHSFDKNYCNRSPSQRGAAVAARFS